MKIFITGATGFVGIHLTELLVKEGHQVYALVRSQKKSSLLPKESHLVFGTLEDPSFAHSLPTDLDAVIHVAGLVHSHDKNLFYKVNTHATERLIVSLKERYSRLHFIFISSLAAMGPGIKSVDSKLLPVSNYGKSKRDAEELLEKIAPLAWTTTVIRPPIVIGPYDTAMLDLFKMCKSRIIPLIGKDAKARSYSFVSVFDLVKLISSVTTSPASERNFYLVAHEVSVTFKEMIESIAKSIGIKKLIYLPLPHSPLKLLTKILDRLPLNLRLTEDKLNEITAESWVLTPNCKADEGLTSILNKTSSYYKESGYL